MGWAIGIILLVAAVAVAVRSFARRARKQSRHKETNLPPVTPGATSGGARRPATRISARTLRNGTFPITWFGPDAELKVAGFRLHGPCVYASAGTESSDWASDPSEILLRAPVKKAARSLPEMGYWPWYSRVAPENRFAYLTWLASDRRSLPPAEGLLFLYFYGIERRLLVDEADREWGLREIVRLRRLDEPRVGLREGRSFRQYSTGLLWFEIARTPDRFDERAFGKAVDLTERWPQDLLIAPLAWVAKRERPLPAWLAQELASNEPTAQRSVVTKRVAEEFNELFATRYRETFGGEGMTLRISQRATWHTYRPASGGLEEMRCQVPNPLGIKSQFKKLPEIWNSCIADLRKLSRVTASVPDGELTAEAWEAMPDELRSQLDHPLVDEVTQLLSNFDDSEVAADEAGVAPSIGMVPAGRLAQLCGIERRPKLTSAQSRKIAMTLEYTGFGIVPDARISPIRYGWEDIVAIVPGLDDDNIESSRYNAAVWVLRLGLSIALADGEADEGELRLLTDHIDAVFNLSPEEQKRLAALRRLLLRAGSNVQPVARQIESLLSSDLRRTLGRLLVAIAASTSGIDRAERGALRKAFRTLGLSPELLEATITEVAPGASEAMATVRTGRAGTAVGEHIPVQRQYPGFSLNREAISSIMSETRAVSTLLADAMGAAEHEMDAQVAEELLEPKDTAPVEGVAGDTLVEPMAEETATTMTLGTGTRRGPGGRYGHFFAELVARERWTRADADGAARRHSLMLDAGVEAINDWAIDSLGAPLIDEDGDVLVVNRSILQQR